MATVRRCEIAAKFTISGPSISRHLSVLRGAGLVTERRHSHHVLSRVAFDHSWLTAARSPASVYCVSGGCDPRSTPGSASPPVSVGALRTPLTASRSNGMTRRAPIWASTCRSGATHPGSLSPPGRRTFPGVHEYGRCQVSEPESCICIAITSAITTVAADVAVTGAFASELAAP